MLSQLPATLDETYERVLTEIGKTNEFHARRLLQCLAVAMRPLHVDELAEILALDFGAEEGIPELKENWRWKDQQISVLSMCSSLIVAVGDKYYGDGDYSVVQFSHFSVKEFLTSDRLAKSSADISRFHVLPEPAHTVVAKACLGILLRPEGDGDNAVADSPLAEYAARYWMAHTRFEKVWSHVEDGIGRLFDPAKPHLKSWLDNSGICRSRFFAGYNLDKHCGSPLYYASLCGFRDLAAHLIAENPQDATGPFGRNPTPLVAALHRGHLDIAELLYQAGADLGIRNDKKMTLLHAASVRGSVGVVRWLFDHGVHDNSQQHSDDTHLLSVDANGHRSHGMTVNEGDERQNTPLHLASQGGHFESVRELLRRGADVTAKNRMHKTPLHLASDNSASAIRIPLGPSEF
jgi:ankyrin repeat protein